MDWPSGREGPSFLCARIPLTKKRARKSSWRACESRGVHAFARVSARVGKEWMAHTTPRENRQEI